MQELTFWKLVADDQFKIRIPIIQRGYAQGRSERRVVEIRKKFLDALHYALAYKNKLLLDFIYGEKTTDKVFVPFDGQQRLTTLFLLHWYAAWRENKFDENYRGEKVRDIFRRFSYETRESSRQFCEQLAKLHGSFMDMELDDNGSKASYPGPLARYFMDQGWFLPGWEHDPTIVGMLVMLDEIHAKFRDAKDLWQSLAISDDCIAFLFQPLDELGSSADEIFIKMNARGKQLTEFEHFKAQFIEGREPILAQKFDGDWQDLFWAQFGPARVDQNPDDEKDWAQEVDSCFCRYLGYLARMLCYLPQASPTPGNAMASETFQSASLFERVSDAISQTRDSLCKGQSNLEFIAASLDRLHSLHQGGKNAIADWFNKIFSSGTDEKPPVPGKIALYSQQTNKSTNLFQLCCLEDSPTRVNEFLFLGCLLALVHKLETAVASKRLRILRNLLVNSESDFRVSNYAEQIKGIVRLMVNGVIDEGSKFNTYQLVEEAAKQNLRTINANNNNLHNCMDWLEDHPLLRGRLSAFANHARSDQNGLVVFDRKVLHEGKHFIEHTIGDTVTLEDDTIDTLIRGLLSQGDYSLRIGKKHFLGGSKRDKMRDLFTSPSMRGPLQSLACITRKINCKSTMLDKISKIADVWLAWMEKAETMDWRWYFIKYSVMRPKSTGSSGFYDWGGEDGRGYSPRSFLQVQLTGVMRSSTNRNPFLWTVYTEAGFNKQMPLQPQWKDSRGYNDDPIVFSCGLALWPEEFSWRIGSPDGRDAALTDKAQQSLNDLCAQFTDIGVDGLLPVPGKNATDKDHEYREYDSVDRIALVVPVVRGLASLQALP